MAGCELARVALLESRRLEMKSDTRFSAFSLPPAYPLPTCSATPSHRVASRSSTRPPSLSYFPARVVARRGHGLTHPRERRHAQQRIAAAATSAFERIRPVPKPLTTQPPDFSPPSPRAVPPVFPSRSSARHPTLLPPSTWLQAAQLRPPLEGILSSSAGENPALYQWNLVRLIYCDGGGYAGTRGALNVSLAPPAAAAQRNASSAGNSISPSTGSTKSTKSSALPTAAIYLDGWNIIQAVIQDLVQKRGMRSASQILLSGSSAGGQATVNLCDWLASSFPSASTRCLVDLGFFLDTRDRAMNYTFRSLAQNLTALHRPSNPTCPY
ncbi:unnamed protein product, partial [Closterium sp. Yama58-4]